MREATESLSIEQLRRRHWIGGAIPSCAMSDSLFHPQSTMDIVAGTRARVATKDSDSKLSVMQQYPPAALSGKSRVSLTSGAAQSACGPGLPDPLCHALVARRRAGA